MFEAVLGLFMGLILMGAVVTFVATQNGAQYGVGGAAILGFLGLIGLLLVVRGFIRTMMAAKSVF